jgi:hypothetical protein
VPLRSEANAVAELSAPKHRRRYVYHLDAATFNPSRSRNLLKASLSTLWLPLNHDAELADIDKAFKASKEQQRVTRYRV